MTSGTTNPTPAPGVASAETQSQILSTLNQLENQRKIAIGKGDQAKANELLKDQIKLVIQVGLYDDGKKLQAELMKALPELRIEIAKAIKEGGVDALKKMIEDQADANKKKREMYMDEIDRMYNSRLATAEGPARLLASFKGFALLLQAFGFDCSDFIKECDQKIEAEYAKVPKKNIEGISGLNAYTNDPTGPLKAMDIAGNAATQSIANLSKLAEDNTAAAVAGATSPLRNGATAAPAGTPPATNLPVDTKQVTSALEAILVEKKIITSGNAASIKAGLEKAIPLAANADGQAATVSSADVDSLALSTQRTINKNGGKVDAAEAMKLTQEAIERARAMAIAGAPHPQPG